jgi:diguanylate cyclase
MPVSHEPWLVLLSVLIAIQGSYVGLSIALDLDDAEGLKHRLLLAGAATTLAVGIWSMHFVGMLAVHFPVPVDYLVFPTLLSFLICVLVVGVAVFSTQTLRYSRINITVSAILMGAGIVSMHFEGMAAVHMSVPHHHHLAAVIASVVVAVATSALALWLLGRTSGRFSISAAAIMLGVGIAGMHYTAMLGIVIDPQPSHAVPTLLQTSLSRETMAILTTCVAFAVSAAFLLSLVPEKHSVRTFAASQAEPTLKAMPTSSQEVTDPIVAAPIPPPRQSGVGNATPLRGLGQPPVRLATTVPVQKEGKPRDIPVSEIFAVRANAHYTYVFDGSTEYFCNWTISEVEGRLDPARFMRVHRSHIIAIDRIASVRRSGDHATAELNSAVRRSVPIARGRFASLRSRFEAQAS